MIIFVFTVIAPLSFVLRNVCLLGYVVDVALRVDHKTSNTEFLGSVEELVDPALLHLALTLVDEPDNSQQVLVRKLQIYQWVWMGVLEDQILEEHTARAQNYLVGTDLLAVSAGKGHITQVTIFKQRGEGCS